MPLHPALALLCLAAAPLLAQSRPAVAESDERSHYGSYNEALSREFFAGCDQNGDDRLDVFEVNHSLDALRAPRDSSGFARLDTDRSGFIEWPEFDAAFRRTLEAGGVFRVRVSRRNVPALPQPKRASPLQTFLQLHDRDGDGHLDAAEVDAMLKSLGLPPAVANSLRKLDRDGSGAISEAELAPWFRTLPEAFRSGNPTAPGTSALRPPWQALDADGNGFIDVDELRRLLLRIDPLLGRWAPAILAALDKDDDGRLGASELPEAGKPPDRTVPGATGPSPER